MLSAFINRAATAIGERQYQCDIDEYDGAGQDMGQRNQYRAFN